MEVGRRAGGKHKRCRFYSSSVGKNKRSGTYLYSAARRRIVAAVVLKRRVVVYEQAELVTELTQPSQEGKAVVDISG